MTGIRITSLVDHNGPGLIVNNEQLEQLLKMGLVWSTTMHSWSTEDTIANLVQKMTIKKGKVTNGSRAHTRRARST